MSDASKAGPALADTVLEVQARMPSDAAVEKAIGELALRGYDRSAFSLPHEDAGVANTPNETADNPTDSIDKTQLRTMGSSMAGYAGAALAAGAVLATGGAAAVAVGAAAAAGAAGVLTGEGVGRAVDAANSGERDARAAAGTLVLSVRTANEDQVREVSDVLRANGASDVQPITRAQDARTAGVSAASWTGE